MSGTGILLALGELMADPSPSDGGEFNSVSVSPGLPGFLAMFVLAVAVVLLAIDMTRRTRRVQARARVHERLAAEDSERAAVSEDSAEIEDQDPQAEDEAAGEPAPEAEEGSTLEEPVEDDGKAAGTDRAAAGEDASPSDDQR